METRTCSRCRRDLPISYFTRNGGRKSGYNGWCRDCMRLWKRKNPEKVNRKYPLSPEQREKNRRAAAVYRAENREKIRAHQAVKSAITAGLLIPPASCPACHGARPEAHHEDYSRPLEVWWLCSRCHKRLHSNKEVANAY